jgi:hypothetical protein
MRTFSGLVCSIALACFASGQVTSTGGGGGPAEAQKDKAKVKGSQQVTAEGGQTAEKTKWPRWQPHPKRVSGPIYHASPGTTPATSKLNLGRDDGQVQQSTAGKPVQYEGGMFYGRGGSTSQSAQPHSRPSPTRDHNVQMTATRHLVASDSPTHMQTSSGAAQSHGKAADGKKKGQIVSPTPLPR